MAWREREIVEFGGLRTYFFPNLALYAVHNSQLIAARPDKANPVAAYVFGASEKMPTEMKMVSILIPNSEDAETVSTGMDACSALGGNFHSHYTKLNDHLQNRLKRTHDLEDPTSAHKTDKIRGILEKITAQNSPKKKFEEICNLCPLDLDFDTFVFCKLLGYYEDEDMVKEYGEELEMIKENVVEMLGKENPGLAELMKNGPAPELSRLLASPLDSDTAQKLIQLIAESYSDDLTSSGSTESLTTVARLNAQLHFLVLRSICSTTSESLKIVSWIPEEIRRRHVFPALQMNRVEKTMEFARGVIEVFQAENSKFGGLPDGILELMENPYSKNAITDVLDAFRFAVRNSKEVFGEDVLLVPESKISNSHLVQSVDTALRFATWIMQNYHGHQNAQNFSCLKDLYFLNAAKAQIYVDGVKKVFGPTPPAPEVIAVKEEPTVVIEKKAGAELILEDTNVTLLLKSAAIKLEESAKKETTKIASRWDCLDQEYSGKNRSVSRGRALKIQTNNDQNLPADLSCCESQAKPHYKEHDEKHQKHHNVPMIDQEQILEKKSSTYDFKRRRSEPIFLQKNPEAICKFTAEQWALNAPKPKPKPEAPPPKRTDLPPRKKFVKPPKIRAPPMSNFQLTGFVGAPLCDHFGGDQRPRRRLFGGIFVGETKNERGYF